MSSCTFQAAIIFLYNAKGGYDYFKEHGKQSLIRCTDIYQSEPFLQTNRVVKILHCVVNNFNEPLIDMHRSLMDNQSKSKDQQITKQLHPACTSIDSFFSTAYDSNRPRFACNRLSTNSALLPPSGDPQKPIISGTNQQYTVPPEEQPELPEQLKQNIDNLVQNFTSTRPEDIFMSSLTLSLGKEPRDELLPNNNQLSEEPQQHLSQMPPINHTFQSSPFKQQKTQIDSAKYPYIDQQNPIDSSSLNSKLPIWDLPSGVTWNSWEPFLKNSV